MRVVVQRVRRASVCVEDAEIGAISAGIVVLAGIHREDGEAEARWVANKLANLRIFDDHEGKLNLSVKDIAGECLLISNFTVCGDAQQGNRPSFTSAAPFEEGKRIFDTLRREVEAAGVRVAAGEYGAEMLVQIENHGPVTILIEYPKKKET